MKGILGIIAVGLMLICATANTGFNGFQIAIRDDLLASYCNRYIAADVETLTSLSYPSVEDIQEIWVFTFDTNVSNIKAVKSSFSAEKGQYSLVDNKFVMTLTDAISVDFTFNWDVYIGKLYLFAGTGTSTIQVHNLKVTQVFESDVVSTLEFEMQHSSLVINGDIVDKIFSNGVEQVIKAAFKKSLFPRIQESLSDALKELDNLYYSQFKTITIEKNGHAIVFSNEYRTPVVTQNDTVKWENLMLDSTVTIEGTECQGEIGHRVEVVKAPSPNIHEMFCINVEIFLAALRAEVQCKIAWEKVDLAQWGLGGEASELFEMVPNLAEYYRKNETYIIKRDVEPEIEINEQKKIIEMTKSYKFTMNNDGAEVITIKATFDIVLEPESVRGEHTIIRLKQTTSFPKSISITPTIDPIGKALVRRFLQYEVEYINRNFFGSTILTVPVELKQREVSYFPSTRSYCIEYPDE